MTLGPVPTYTFNKEVIRDRAEALYLPCPIYRLCLLGQGSLLQ
jgi:hypothetical protein